MSSNEPPAKRRRLQAPASKNSGSSIAKYIKNPFFNYTQFIATPDAPLIFTRYSLPNIIVGGITIYNACIVISESFII